MVTSPRAADVRRAIDLLPIRRTALSLTLAFAAGLLAGQAGVPLRAAASECDAARPEWLMCEDFEDGHLGWAEWFAASPFTECIGCRPDGTNNPDRIRLTDDPGAAYSGDWAIHMPAAEAAGFQGGALTFRTCDGPKRAGCNLVGHERLHFRVRVRLAEDHAYVHHFLSIDGTRPNRYWDADGNAGCRPNGLRAVGTTLDFNRDRELFFYTYFPDMRCDSGGYCSGDTVRDICALCATKEMPCSRGPECCWGNHFAPEPPFLLPRGQWVCLELMMELNTPGRADGRMAFWVDGLNALEVTGMRLRDIPELQLNKAWLQHYIAGGDAEQANAVWFDDMVVSTDYIGCAGPQATEPATATAAPTGTPSATAGATATEPPTPDAPTLEPSATAPAGTMRHRVHLPALLRAARFE